MVTDGLRVSLATRSAGSPHADSMAHATTHAKAPNEPLNRTVPRKVLPVLTRMFPGMPPTSPLRSQGLYAGGHRDTSE